MDKSEDEEKEEKDDKENKNTNIYRKNENEGIGNLNRKFNKYSKKIKNSKNFFIFKLNEKPKEIIGGFLIYFKNNYKTFIEKSIDVLLGFMFKIYSKKNKNYDEFYSQYKQMEIMINDEEEGEGINYISYIFFIIF
jgi:hypothetical protein